MDIVRIAVGSVDVDLIGDDRICQHIRKGESFEPKTLNMWAHWCVHASLVGQGVLDIGAYSGLFSIAAAKLGAVPMAFEPQPNMVARIAENKNLNNVNFEVIDAAASDETGVARLGVNGNVHLTSGASLLRKSGGGIDVSTIRLDDLPIASCAAIKIDVERAEVKVLRGAKALVARFKPRLLIEALDADARAAIEAELPDYHVHRVLDARNLMMLPN